MRRHADHLGVRLDTPGRPELAGAPLRRIRSASVGGHGRHAGVEAPVGNDVPVAMLAKDREGLRRWGADNPLKYPYSPPEQDRETAALEAHQARIAKSDRATRP